MPDSRRAAPDAPSLGERASERAHPPPFPVAFLVAFPAVSHIGTCLRVQAVRDAGGEAVLLAARRLCVETATEAERSVAGMSTREDCTFMHYAIPATHYMFMHCAIPLLPPAEPYTEEQALLADFAVTQRVCASLARSRSLRGVAATCSGGH